ncbi:hypothetical protein O3M35_001597 [Rhynocoris fuscipes]|uniref:CHK kinase-like domain-containing protein n=1 Tax=Rhynocoris fuscipes TaxID=488301 RepID=A0AAW1CU08_9HEMI
MNSITIEQCNIVLNNYLGHKNYKILNYNVKNSNKTSIGYLSTSLILLIKFINNNKINEIRFFIKLLPDTEYQLNLVKTANCFKKESAFYGELFQGIRAFLSYKSIPDCYLNDNESIIILEDLKMSDYKTCSAIDIDIKHIYAAIKTLADIHAASLIYEHKIGKTLDNIFPEEILRSWFHKYNPGYKESLNSAKIIEIIIDKYYRNYDINIINKAKFLCKNYSNFLDKKSEKYRNVITHFDIWCNNMLFKYDNNENVDNCIIIDFQTYGYNTPALDLLLLIYINLDRNKIIENQQKFIDYYYNCLLNNFKNYSINANDLLLNKEEFLKSINDAIPIALTGRALFSQSADIAENQIIH